MKSLDLKKLLLSCVLNETRGAAVAEDRAAQDGTVRALPPRTEGWSTGALRTGLYTLHLAVLAGCDLPLGPDVYVRVSWSDAVH